MEEKEILDIVIIALMKNFRKKQSCSPPQWDSRNLIKFLDDYVNKYRLKNDLFTYQKSSLRSPVNLKYNIRMELITRINTLICQMLYDKKKRFVGLEKLNRQIGLQRRKIF